MKRSRMIVLLSTITIATTLVACQNTQTQTQAESTSQVQAQQSPPAKPWGEVISRRYGSKIKLNWKGLGYGLASFCAQCFETLLKREFIDFYKWMKAGYCDKIRK